MGADQEPGTEPAGTPDTPGSSVTIDARYASGVAVGDGVTQINNSSHHHHYWQGPAASRGPSARADGPHRVDSPYQGLSAFEEGDAAFFFGRDTVASEILERMSGLLDGAGLLIVSGVSGVGKSSLLRAGVLPRLSGEGLASAPGAAAWPRLVFTPTPAPLDELAVQVTAKAGGATMVRRELAADPAGFALTARAAALAATAGSPVQPAAPPSVQSTAQPRLLIVVDQFEQLFTRCPDERERRAFIAALHAAATAPGGPGQRPPALVVLAVRADFEPRCADYPELVAAVKDRYLVTPMSEGQLRLAITQPAAVAGASAEDALVAELLEKVVRGAAPPLPAGVAGPAHASRAGVLPLLSHALDEAWREHVRRGGGVVTLADYEAIGGIEGAVAKSAQSTYGRLTPGQRRAAREVFVRLAAADPDGTDLADQASHTELLAGKDPAQARDVAVVLEEFARQRLLILGADTVEISHEALLTAWPLLRDEWLAQTRADRIVRARLRNTAAEWLRQGKDPSYLYAGSLLEAAGGAAARAVAGPARHPPLSEHERDFLQASARAHTRRTRRTRRFVALLTALATGLAVVAGVAFHAERQTVHQRDIAVAGQLVLASETASDPRTADLEALAAWHLNPAPESRYAMLAAATRPQVAVLSGWTGEVASVAFSPRGDVLAGAGSDGTFRLYSATTHQPLGKPIDPHAGSLTSVAFSPGGSLLAVGCDDGTLRLYGAATRQSLGKPIDPHAGAVRSMAFSPDGKTLASVYGDGKVRLWSVATRRPLGQAFTAGAMNAAAVAFSPDGKTLAVGGSARHLPDGIVQLWDIAARQPLGRPLRTQSGGPEWSVAFSPDGKTLASGGDDGIVRLWDIAKPRPTGQSLDGLDESITSVAFSPDGRVLAGGDFSGAVRLWDTGTRQLLDSPFRSTATDLQSVQFSPDGKTLAAGYGDGTIRLWDMATWQPFGGPRDTRTGSVQAMAVSPGGHILAVGGAGDTVQLWDMATRQPLGSFDSGTGPVWSGAFSPDGKTLALGGAAGPVLWHITERAAGPSVADVSNFRGAVQPAYAVAFSPNGELLAVGQNSTFRLWDVTTHRPAGPPVAVGGQVASVAFSPDGRVLAVGGDAGVQLWNVAAGRPAGHPFAVPDLGVRSVAFSPDSGTLATGGVDGTVRFWSVATRQPVSAPLASSSGRETIYSVAYSPDGSVLAAGASDGMRLWDTQTAQPIDAPRNGREGGPGSLVFSADGNAVVTGGGYPHQGIVEFWDVSYLTDVVGRLCGLAGYPFTPGEWTRHLPPGPAYQRLCP